jgi:hypothetical protein
MASLPDCNKNLLNSIVFVRTGDPGDNDPWQGRADDDALVCAGYHAGYTSGGGVSADDLLGLIAGERVEIFLPRIPAYANRETDAG